MMNLVSDLTRCLIRRARVAPAFLLLVLRAPTPKRQKSFCNTGFPTCLFP